MKPYVPITKLQCLCYKTIPISYVYVPFPTYLGPFLCHWYPLSPPSPPGLF